MVDEKRKWSWCTLQSYKCHCEDYICTVGFIIFINNIFILILQGFFLKSNLKYKINTKILKCCNALE
jgi:hypothetical protein